METAVVILNYNGIGFLQQFLKKAIYFSPQADVIVVDNCSTDESVAYLQANFPATKLILLDQNYGFAGGYNLAIEQIPHKFVVLLNSDVELSQNWLLPLINLVEKNEEIAAIQPKIKDFYKREYFEYAGAAGGMLDFLGYAFCKGRLFDTLEKDKAQYNNADEIFWASGACLFIKRQIFIKFGGFDTCFFAHFEEIDLCWRIKNEGYKIMYCPDSEVFHVGGGTLNKSNSFKTFLNFRNNLATLYKNLPANKLIPIIFCRLLLDGISSLKFLMAANFKDFFAVAKAHLAFYMMIPKLKRSTKFLAFDNLYPKSIVWKYFVKKVKVFSEL